MSKYTSIILFIPGSENETERIKEVNKYKLTSGIPIDLTDVNTNPFPDMFPRFIYCGTYNFFDTPKFIHFLRNEVLWESKEHVRLIVKEEESESLDYYTLG